LCAFVVAAVYERPFNPAPIPASPATVARAASVDDASLTGARFSFISLFCWPPLSPPRATVSHRPLLFVVFVRSVARSSCSFVCPSTVVVSVERCPCWWQRGRVASLIAVGSRLPAPPPIDSCRCLRVLSSAARASTAASCGRLSCCCSVGPVRCIGLHR
jgi:hypothetical protein